MCKSKKIQTIIILIIVAALFNISSVASASNVESYYNFERGWNLVYGFVNPNKLSGGDIVSENIKAIYILKQPVQEFVRIFPNPETEKLAGLNDDYYERTAQFVYSNKAGRSEYFYEEPLPPKYWNEHKIYKGWNMIGLSEYMVEGPLNPELTLADIQGTCDIKRAYYLLDGQWIKFDLPEMDSTLLLKGLLAEVSNDCEMGVVKREIDSFISPPQIPSKKF